MAENLWDTKMCFIRFQNPFLYHSPLWPLHTQHAKNNLNHPCKIFTKNGDRISASRKKNGAPSLSYTPQILPYSPLQARKLEAVIIVLYWSLLVIEQDSNIHSTATLTSGHIKITTALTRFHIELRSRNKRTINLRIIKQITHLSPFSSTESFGFFISLIFVRMSVFIRALTIL